MRWTRSHRRKSCATNEAAADGEVVWSWRSDAGVKVVKTLSSVSRATVATKHGTGRSRISRKNRCAGRAGISAEPVVRRVRFFLHAAMGISRYPAFLRLSIARGTCLPHHSGAKRQRERGRMSRLGCLKSHIGTTSFVAS